MALRRISVPAADPSGALERRFAAIRAELDVPERFPAEVLRAAEASARAPSGGRTDLTHVPFITIDPPGSRDLDQALWLGRESSGFRARYAIADVPAFVPHGGPVDREARVRGVTIYCPDGRTPLHPPVLSEDAASLLPRTRRAAMVWDLRLDGDGEVIGASLERAVIASRASIDYAQALQAAASGAPAGLPWPLELLREVGERRIALERARGGASLPMPAQEVVVAGDGYALRFRPPLPTEEWNAQVSLMTGMTAAQAMIDARIGILRTMPAPEERAVERVRRQAHSLGVAWPADTEYGAFLRSLDRSDPAHLVVIHEATGLFRGAAYVAFDGAAPAEQVHGAVAAPYAHVTAPLRRLVDRFGLSACEAILSGRPVPEWVRAALPDLPEIMRSADRRAAAVERACVDAVEAAVLHPHVGAHLDGTVVDVRGDDLVVQLHAPAVVAKVRGRLAEGARVRVGVEAVDVPTATVRLSVVPAAG